MLAGRLNDRGTNLVLQRFDDSAAEDDNFGTEKFHEVADGDANALGRFNCQFSRPAYARTVCVTVLWKRLVTIEFFEDRKSHGAEIAKEANVAAALTLNR